MADDDAPVRDMGEILVNEHKHDDAEAMLREAIRVFQASDFRDGQALAETYLGRSLLDRGELEGAEQVLLHAIAARHPHG